MNLGQSPSTVPLQPVERDKIFQWILELSYLDTRENALLELRFFASIFLTCDAQYRKSSVHLSVCLSVHSVEIP